MTAEEIRKEIQSHPCRECGQPADDAYARPIEIGPYQAPDGTLWKQWRQGEVEWYCAAHFPTLVE